MKLLEIKDNKGYYCDDQGEFATVDKIPKDDILRLVPFPVIQFRGF